LVLTGDFKGVLRMRCSDGKTVSRITDYLYISSRIGSDNWGEVESVGPELIISMIGGKRYSKLRAHGGIKFLRLRSYDTFFTPISMSKLLEGVGAAKPVIESGGKVLVYCRAGMRRSVTMGAAILISRGFSSSEAISVIKERRKIADPTRWYVKWRIGRFEKVWKKAKGCDDV
jgi:protein tyrosine phosphatase (PTP) superfamily phosphohydrolase (DUF442 family)